MTQEVKLAKLTLSLSSVDTTYMLSLLLRVCIPPSRPLRLFNPHKRKETALSVSGKVPGWYVRSLGGLLLCARVLTRRHKHTQKHTQLCVGDIRAHWFPNAILQEVRPGRWSQEQLGVLTPSAHNREGAVSQCINLFTVQKLVK